MANPKVGSFPFIIGPKTLVDDDGAAIDVSAYAQVTLHLYMPDRTKKTFSATFTTDGSDGKVQYITDSASDLDQAGHYTAEFLLGDGVTARVPSDIFHFDVDQVISTELP